MKIYDKVKVIKHNLDGINRPKEESLKYTLEVRFTIAGLFMEYAARAIYGSQEIIVLQSNSLKQLLSCAMEKFKRHPRLQSCMLTTPIGEIDLYKRWKR